MFAFLGCLLAFAPALVTALKQSADLESLPAVASTCQAFPGKRIILTMTNTEYVPMLRNWHAHAKGFLTSADQLVVVAHSWKTFRAISNGADAIPGAAIVDPNQTLHSLSLSLSLSLSSPASHTSLVNHNQTLHIAPTSMALAPYGTAEYQEVVNTKPLLILSFLDLGCTVFYVDIDTVWTASPFSDMAALGEKDLYIQSDDPSGPNDLITPTWRLCTCFVYAQPTPSMISLVQDWVKALPGHEHDQDTFNDVLKHFYDSHGRTYPGDLALMPYNAYPPGCSAPSYPHAHVFHANWVVGIDRKVKFFKDRDLWS